MDQARAWWSSPEYTEAKLIRQATSEGTLLILEGACRWIRCLEVLEPLLGLQHVPAAAARGDGGDSRRPRFGRRPAHRRRQVAVLPGAGAGATRPGAGRLAADLADEGSGRQPDRATACRRPASTARCRRTSARRSCRACAKGATGCSTSRRSGWRRRAATSFIAQPDAERRQLHRRGRGALHQPVGARLPSRVPAARAAAPGVSRRQPACLHGDGDRARARRHRRAARAAGAARAGRLVRSAEPDLPRAVARAAEAADARRARPASRPRRHHLLHVAPRGRRAGRVAVARRACGPSPITPG